MKCQSELERLIGAKVLVKVTATTGTPDATVLFQVWGFHPLLRVMVYVYFHRTAGTPAGTHTWTATAIKRDSQGSGAQRNLQAIFSGRSLYDGHEVNSGAEGIEYSVTVGNQNTGSVAGSWIAEVVAMPEHPMEQELFEDLCQRLKLVVDTNPPTRDATIP